MKKLVLFSFLLLSIASYAQEPLKVMTFNIRLNTASDSLNAWPYRKDNLASQVLYYQVHLLGVQEALPLQMNDLRKSLTRYKAIGGGREDGKDVQIKPRLSMKVATAPSPRLRGAQYGRFRPVDDLIISEVGPLRAECGPTSSARSNTEGCSDTARRTA